MENPNIPTAEEFLSKNIDYVLEKDCKEDVEHAMIEFAKLHVEAALKAGAENAKITYEYEGNTGSEYPFEYVDKDSILNAYPPANIK